MFALQQMRKEMVKRPLLATFEKWMQPLRAKGENAMVMGYTHTAYKVGLAKIIKDFSQTNQSVIVRGIEGSPRAPLSRDSTVMFYDGKEYHEEFSTRGILFCEC